MTRKKKFKVKNSKERGEKKEREKRTVGRGRELEAIISENKSVPLV